MIKVWGRKSSSNVQAVRWCLRELDLEHRQIDAGFRYGVVDTEEYLSMNPNGTIPTLIDGNLPPLWESMAINRYLAGRYSVDPFWPADIEKRAVVDQWAEWVKINVALNFTGPLFWAVVRTAPSKRNYPAISTALKGLDKYLAIADKQLAGNEYLVGDDFTLADIVLGHVLYRYFDIDIERTEYQHLKRYYDLLVQRPAYRATVMISYEELRVTD